MSLKWLCTRVFIVVYGSIRLKIGGLLSKPFNENLPHGSFLKKPCCGRLPIWCLAPSSNYGNLPMLNIQKRGPKLGPTACCHLLLKIEISDPFLSYLNLISRATPTGKSSSMLALYTSLISGPFDVNCVAQRVPCVA